MSDPFFLFSFLDSRLFSFSLSRSLSRLLSFSAPLSASRSLDSSSEALSLLRPRSGCEPGVNHGKSGPGLLQGKGSAGALLCFRGLWLFSAGSPGGLRE